MAEPTSRPPNVLWIFADQLRHHALGCNGDDDARTPNIDRLAARGLVCETAVSQCPVCMPFRGGLVTGQYCNVHGVRVHGDLLTPDRRTVAHAFREAGYRTSYVGKLHLASTNSNWTTSLARPRCVSFSRTCMRGSAGPSWNPESRFRISCASSPRNSESRESGRCRPPESARLRTCLREPCADVRPDTRSGVG